MREVLCRFEYEGTMVPKDLLDRLKVLSGLVQQCTHYNMLEYFDIVIPHRSGILEWSPSVHPVSFLRKYGRLFSEKHFFHIVCRLLNISFLCTEIGTELPSSSICLTFLNIKMLNLVFVHNMYCIICYSCIMDCCIVSFFQHQFEYIVASFHLSVLSSIKSC